MRDSGGEAIGPVIPEDLVVLGIGKGTRVLEGRRGPALLDNRRVTAAGSV